MTQTYWLKKLNIHTNTHTKHLPHLPGIMVGRFDDNWNMYDLYGIVFLTAGCFLFTVNDYRNGQGEADLQHTRGALWGRAKIRGKTIEHVHWLHQKDIENNIERHYNLKTISSLLMNCI